jgi:hypothetical protein
MRKQDDMNVISDLNELKEKENKIDTCLLKWMISLHMLT